MENICLNGHVIDPGKELCTRCNAPKIGEVQVEVEKKEEVSIAKKANKKSKKAVVSKTTKKVVSKGKKK